MSKLGLVLAGGGGKGAYQFGVWKALNEYGVANNFAAISGTSIGGLNAALFVQGSLELCEEVWRNISHEKVFTVDKRKLAEVVSESILTGIGISKSLLLNLIASSNGIFTREGLLDIIDEYIDLSLIANSNVKLYATCCEIRKNITDPLTPTYFQMNNQSSNKIKKVLLATSALPVIFKPEIIEGRKYIDGGVVDNVPVKPLYEDGCDVILVVHLDRSSTVKHDDFPNCTILEISLTENQGGLIDGILDFSPEGASRRIEQGYIDAWKLLEPLYRKEIIQSRVMHNCYTKRA